MATAMRLDFTNPHLLRNAKEYDAAVAEINTLLDADVKKGSVGHDRLEFLSVLVEAYDDKHYPIENIAGTPQSMVEFMLEQKGMTRAELVPIMGGKSRVSEFFAGKRRLSIEQIIKLRDELGIPADLLISR